MWSSRLLLYALAVLAAAVLPLRAQRVPALALTRELRIDAAQADLSRITWIAVARDGSIAVDQGQDHLIRFFDARGVSLGTFGREGSGPGEFRMMSVHGWLADTLWVIDGGQRRFTLVSPERTLVRTFPEPSYHVETNKERHVPSINFGVPWALYADGSMLLMASVTGDSPVRLVTMSDGRRASGASIRSSSTGVLERGDTLLSRGYPFTPIPISKRAADSAFGRSSDDARIPQIAAAARGFRAPPYFPPLRRLLNGRDGTVWVELRTVSTGHRWRVLSSAGAVVGDVSLPASVSIKVADQTTIWATDSDIMGLQSIVRYRVALASAGMTRP